MKHCFSAASILLIIAVIFYAFSAIPWYLNIGLSDSYVVDIKLSTYNNTDGSYYVLFNKNSFYIETLVREDDYTKVIECTYDNVIENNNICGNLTISNAKSIKEVVQATTGLSWFNSIFPIVVTIFQIAISIHHSINKEDPSNIFKYFRFSFFIVNITCIVYSILVYGVLENSMNSIGGKYYCDIGSCLIQYISIFFSFLGLPFLLASVIINIIRSRKSNHYSIIH